MVPAGKFLQPRRFDLGDLRAPFVGGLARFVVLQRIEQLTRNGACIAANGDVDGFGQPQHVGIAVDLNDLRIARPVFDGVLRQGAERIQSRAERQDDVGFLGQLHR